MARSCSPLYGSEIELDLSFVNRYIYDSRLWNAQLVGRLSTVCLHLEMIVSISTHDFGLSLIVVLGIFWR